MCLLKPRVNTPARCVVEPGNSLKSTLSRHACHTPSELRVRTQSENITSRHLRNCHPGSLRQAQHGPSEAKKLFKTKDPAKIDFLQRWELIVNE